MDDKKFILGLGVVLVVILLVAVATSSNTSDNNTPKSNGLPVTQESETGKTSLTGKMLMTLETVNKEINQSGTATLEEKEGKLEVVLTLNTAGPSGPQPAHIHSGDCPGVGAVVYPLTNVVDGKSTTLIDTTLEKLQSQLPLAINIHKSADEVKVYTACGSLK